MSQELPTLCDDATRLLERRAAARLGGVRQKAEAFALHAASCANCAKVFCALERLNEDGSLPPDEAAWAAATAGMTAEAGWQDLLRRSPDLAAEYQRELQQERPRRLARRIGVISSLAACILVSIALGLRSFSQRAGGLMTSIESQKHSNVKTVDRTDSLDGDLALELLDVPAEVLPSINGVDYAAWLNQNADWFAAEFPSSKGVNIQQSDYIERLAISGDLFQFKGDPAGAENQLVSSSPSPATDRSALIALSKIGEGTPSAAQHPIIRWMNAVAAAERGGAAGPTQLLIFSLRAGRYFVNTREAAALWAVHHGDEAKAMFGPRDGRRLVYGVALPTSGDASKDLPRFFQQQALEAAQIMRATEDLLSVSPNARCLSSSKDDWQKLRDAVAQFRDDSQVP